MTLICRPYFLLRLTFSFISGQIISVCMECSYPRAYSSDFSQIKKLAAVKTHSGNDIPIGIKSNEISYFYPRIVLPPGTHTTVSNFTLPNTDYAHRTSQVISVKHFQHSLRMDRKGSETCWSF